MGDVFRRLEWASAALLLCGACAMPSLEPVSDGPAPQRNDTNTLPPSPADAAPDDTTTPSDAGTPPMDEVPAPDASTVVVTPPPVPKTLVFLLFGQSNMWGVPNPEAQDLEINPRVEVLTTKSCAKHGTNQWVPAQPPLHGCVGQPGTGGQGPGVGPGDYFAKTLADAFPEDTILLVPNAVPGVSIDTFQPGQQNYTSLLARARMAQERGEISGMIFHQGESDSGQSTWPSRVKTVVEQLRSDLGIGDVPFVAGELLYTGCCSGHNVRVNQLPSVITSTAVATAEGFTAVPKSQDTYGNLHFDLVSQREFGRRYAQTMIDQLGN
jgi:hypothetical protein